MCRKNDLVCRKNDLATVLRSAEVVPTATKRDGPVTRDEEVLVVGGTRGTGLLVVQLLLRDGYRVRALTRHAERAKARLDPTVEVILGDLTRPETIPPAVHGVAHIVFTAGVPVGPARESLIKATEYEGAVKTLAAARREGFRGRFVYMTAIGVTRSSLTGTLLNLAKGNTLRWRRRVEDEIRASGADYAIIRAGFLLNKPGGTRAIELTQEDLPLKPRYRIARADVAETIVEALKRPRASRATFDVVWGRGARREAWDTLFARVKTDA